MTSSKACEAMSAVKDQNITTDCAGARRSGSPSLHNINHAHKLERKHSSGDLHSRLKTRKLLGVGETDDGDVHRSKLSQILGHSEQLHVKLPKGLRIWQTVLALMFTITSVWALLLPKGLFKFVLHQDGEDDIILPIRLYGGTMLSFSLVFWVTLRAMDKDLIRWALLSSFIYFVMQILVTSLTLLQQGQFIIKVSSLLLHRILFASISLYYYWILLDGKGLRARQSISTCTQDFLASASK